jgi:hypothetical protein
MNLKSEIEFFGDLRLLDKARLLNMFLHELAEEARGTYGPTADEVHDTAHLRFVNELTHRLTRVIEQLLAEDATRPADDVSTRSPNVWSTTPMPAPSTASRVTTRPF